MPVITSILFYHDDDDGLWSISFRDRANSILAETPLQFATIGTALDWAVKWANDRGLAIPIDAMTMPVISLRERDRASS